MNITRGHSCILCQQRKVRCDQQKPCANCVKAQVDCKVIPPQPPKRRRKKKLQERDLVARLKKYEELMSQHGLNFESILDGHDDVDDPEQHLGSMKTAPEESTDRGSREVNSKYSKWLAYYSEYRTTEDLLHDSSDEEYERPTIHHAFDTMFSDTDSFPFVVGGLPALITGLHPPAIRIFQLWQIYIDNVNPLLKISHVPTLQVQIVEVAADLANAPKSLEALMFSIYLISVNSMSDDEVQNTFGEDKIILLGRYHEGAQQALINAGFMRSNEITVLQAYVLYLFGVGQYVDPRSLFCLIGIATRIATRLGLHRDGVQSTISPFEIEQRRRLWWQIVALDKRIAEITGSAITALSSCGTDCRLPLNVNDTDLHVNAKDLPAPYLGATEMVFCLARIELTIAASPSGIRTNPSIVNKPPLHRSSSLSTSQVASHVSRQSPVHHLDGYCAYIESTYLTDCDKNIPVQLFTLMMTRMSLCKLRIVDSMSSNISATKLDDREREALFLSAIQMLEYDSVIYSTNSLTGFLWYTRLQAPLPGYIFLVNELRQRNTGQLCERAWKALCDSYDHRGLSRNAKSPMHTAFGKMVIKAWDAHEKAELQLGRTVQPPKLVTFLRQCLPLNAEKHQVPSNSQQGSDTTRTESDAGVAGINCRSGLDNRDQSPGIMFHEDTMFPSLDPTNQTYGIDILGYNETDWAYLTLSGGS